MDQLGDHIFGALVVAVVQQAREEVLGFGFGLRVAEYDFMSSSREDRSELPAHQSRAQDADAHTALPRLSLSVVPQRPTSFCSSSGYRAPCTAIFEAAVSSCRRSSGV